MVVLKFETEITGPDADSVWQVYHELIYRAIQVGNTASPPDTDLLVLAPHDGPPEPEWSTLGLSAPEDAT